MRSKGLFLVGRAPGTHPGHNPEVHALYPYPPGCSGHRLWRMTGLLVSRYISIPRRNVIPRYPGRQGGGDAFPMREARRYAEQMLPMIEDHSVVFVGKGVAEAFGRKGEWCRWYEGSLYDWAILPHPSGRNRWYNDQKNRWTAESFMQDAAERHTAILQPAVRHRERRQCT